MAKLNRKALADEMEALRGRLQHLRASGDAGRAERIERTKSDFRYFCQHYFPHHVDPDGKHCAPSGLHEWIVEEVPGWGPGRREAVAAPRGNAKTTYLARLYPLWRHIRGDVKNVIVVGASQTEAAGNIEVIKLELEDNARLAEDFPEFTGEGRVWQATTIVANGPGGAGGQGKGCRFKAYGRSQRMRGANWTGRRPDLVILDDLEDDELVRSKDQRDKLWNWLTKTVFKLGPPDGSAQFVYIGTILHHDSALKRIEKRPDFRFTKFKAVISWPVNMDLWERWETIYHADQDAAEDFYYAHFAEMNEGADVLWPAVQPLYLLMCERAADRAAFSCEMQNEPLDPETQIFKLESFHFCNTPPPIVVTVGALDPALGKHRSDFSALVILGRDAERYVHVLEADIGRYTPLATIGRMVFWQSRYRCSKWGIEFVAFQEVMKDLAVQQSLLAGVPLPVVGVKTGGRPKDIRIESLAPHVENGVIRFNPAHTLLIDQLTEYPLGAHDDGPDALEIGFKLIHTAAPIEFKAPSGRDGGPIGKLKRWIGRGF